jgi:hypothetical protein
MQGETTHGGHPPGSSTSWPSWRRMLSAPSVRFLDFGEGERQGIALAQVAVVRRRRCLLSTVTSHSSDPFPNNPLTR